MFEFCCITISQNYSITKSKLKTNAMAVNHLPQFVSHSKEYKCVIHFLPPGQWAIENYK